jgi:hypothetical protein
MTLLARQDAVNRRAKIGEKRDLEPGIIKRRGERTPDKEFVSGDKANWKAQENRRKRSQKRMIWITQKGGS